MEGTGRSESITPGEAIVTRMRCACCIALIVGILVFISGAFGPSPQSQIFYIQTETPASVSGGLGCLPWLIIGFVLLVGLGVIRF